MTLTVKTPIPTQSPPILSPSPSPAPAKPPLAEVASQPLPREADALCEPKNSSSARPLKSPPSVASNGDGRNSKVNGKRKATDMMASFSEAAQPVSSPDRNSKKGARLVTGDTSGSAAAEVAAVAALTVAEDKDKDKRESTAGGRSDPPGETVSSSSIQKGSNNNSSSNGVKKATSKGKSKIANTGGVGGSGAGVGNMLPPPPPPYVFSVMVVEALLALSDSRGTSQLATLNWLKASRYRPLAMVDEAKFKANVAAGIKQASGGTDCMRVLMVTEASPM